MKWNVFIALVTVLTGGGLAVAQDDIPLLAPDIESVVSAGPWSADGNGWYRAIIRTGGFELIVSDLTLQWMQEPSGAPDQRRDASSVVVQSVVIRPCIGRLDDPQFSYPVLRLLPVETFIGPGEWYVTNIQDSKQTSTNHKVVSQDGKRLTVTKKGMSSSGDSFEQIEVYDRQ